MQLKSLFKQFLSHKLIKPNYHKYWSKQSFKY